MHRDRLIKIRDHIRDNVVDERFNLGTWVGSYNHPWGGLQDLSCGTVACAMGHAATIPEFQALGLRLTSGGESGFGYIAFQESYDMEAVRLFLDIKLDDAAYLFSPYRYSKGDNTPRQVVIDRIDAYLDLSVDVNG